MKTTNLVFIKRFGNVEYDYFTNRFTFEVIDAYDELLTDDLGSYAKYKEIVVYKMTFTKTMIDGIGGYKVFKKELEDKFDFVWE